MNSQQQTHFQQLYTDHLNHLTLQGKRPATIDAYARAVRRISAFFDCPPDKLTLELALVWCCIPTVGDVIVIPICDVIVIPICMLGVLRE